MVFREQRQKRRIAIFGGSFNPPHIGHTAICKWLFSKGIIDELWVIPCYRHPFNKVLEKFEHRLKMLKLALGRLMLPIKFLHIEKKLGGMSHTIRTIEHLRKENPDCRFYLVTGTDVRREAPDWYQFDKIREVVEIIEVPRGEDSSIPDVSSTEIRKNIQKGETFHKDVEGEVALYIITKSLYREKD